MKDRNIVRGHGLLDNFIGKLRIKFVEKNIPIKLRTGKICDIGCGYYPKFLLNTEFKEKYGVDQIEYELEVSGEIEQAGIKIVKHDLTSEESLPFEDGFFDLITFLAVVEHLIIDDGERILREIYRILKKDGTLILTTPNKWTDPILRTMAAVGLASKPETADHKQMYNPKTIKTLVQRAGFKEEQIKIIRFELNMNIGVISKK